MVFLNFFMVDKNKSEGMAQTPLMVQYQEIKEKYPHTLLLFRVGDFYETFGDDAHTLHKVTDVKLTKRSNGAAGDVPLAGFPYHALDVYLPKLIRAGLRIAVCDQMEEAQKGKTLVQRKVTELITPGVTYHDQVLKRKSNNYLASVHFGDKVMGLAFLDISTGEFLVTQGDEGRINKLLQSFLPAEIIFNKKKIKVFQAVIQEHYHQYMLEEWIYNMMYAERRLNGHFGTSSLKSFGIASLTEGIVAAGAIMRYLEETEHHDLQHITSIRRIDEGRYMWLDRFTIRNLELLIPQEEEGVALMNVLDETVTPMGARKLRKWLLFPLKEETHIQERLDRVQFFVTHGTLYDVIRKHLEEVGDLERLISKVASKRINPRELQVLKKSLLSIIPIKEEIQRVNIPTMMTLVGQLNPCVSIVESIDKTLQDFPPLQSNQGGLIKPGVSQELEELRSIALESNVHLQRVQDEERKKTGINSLKIGYNKVFGYYLEVTHTHKDKVPAHWIRKQTLVNAERFITEELKKYEEKILYAHERINTIELEIYQKLVQEMSFVIADVQKNAKIIGRIDCYSSLAHVATKYDYVRPVVCTNNVIDIDGGRHPVIERYLPVGQAYVANDVYLDDKEQILLITGPNMAGKSALLRQTAIIVLMAQMGSFVPAKRAMIGIRDSIFTRVGAHDNIAKQESTFMVEMNEMSMILHNLTERSLVIIDELGRGTGTADGLALAESIIRYLHNHPYYQVPTLFATHYHELNELERELGRVKNYHVTVKEVGDKILFLHKLELGGSQNSFGIHVAKMAGIPTDIIEHAHRLIKKAQHKRGETTKNVEKRITYDTKQMIPPVIQALKEIEIDVLSPVEALLQLQQLKSMLPKV